eukprot:5575509-Prymnesium_polylepis.1
MRGTWRYAMRGKQGVVRSSYVEVRFTTTKEAMPMGGDEPPGPQSPRPVSRVSEGGGGGEAMFTPLEVISLLANVQRERVERMSQQTGTALGSNECPVTSTLPIVVLNSRHY